MTDSQRADFEAWYDSYDPRTPQSPFDRELARKAWDAAMQSPEVQTLVREALEKAVSICEAAYEQGSTGYAISRNSYFEGGCDAIESIEQKIRSLIPKENT